MHIQAKLDQDGEMNQMPLVSRHRIMTLAVWGRRRYISVTEALHNSGRGKNILFSVKPSRPESEPRTLARKTVQC